MKPARVSAKHPNACPHCSPSLMETPNGNQYVKRHPCNNSRTCPPCKIRLDLLDILKVREGLQRSEWWQQTQFDPDSPEYANQLRTILAKLNRWGLWYTSNEWVVRGRRCRVIFHEPIPGWRPRGAIIRGRKRTLKDISRLIRSNDSRAVRFARASKSRPCWPKNTTELKRAADKRLPDEKHKLVVSSPLGPKRFDKLSVQRIGRTVPDGGRISRAEATAVFVLNRRWEPDTRSSPSRPCSTVGVRYVTAPITVNAPANNQEARFVHSERDERRMERASWYDSSG